MSKTYADKSYEWLKGCFGNFHKDVPYYFGGAMFTNGLYCLTLVLLPAIFAQWDSVVTNGVTPTVVHPSVVVLIIASFYFSTRAWPAMVESDDVPTVNNQLSNVFYGWYRGPLNKHMIKSRVTILVYNVLLAGVTLFGATLGIYAVSQFQPTISFPAPGVNNIGQPVFDNTFLTHGASIVFVMVLSAVPTWVHINKFLGNDRTNKYLHAIQKDEVKQLPSVSSGLAAFFILFEVALFKGHVSWEYVIGTMIVSGNTADSGLFIGSMTAGMVVAVVYSFLCYFYPALAHWFTRETETRQIEGDNTAVE